MRGTASLGASELEGQTSNVANGNVDAARSRTIGSNPSSIPSPHKNQKIRLGAIVRSLILDVKVGAMSREVFGQGRTLLFEACKKGRPDLATSVLERLLQECVVNPSTYTLYRSMFNVTLSAWGALGEVEMVEKIFSLMERTHAQLPNIVPAPDRYSYNALLGAWAASPLPIAHDRVLHIFQQMEDSEHVQPDAYTYNIVMTSYANRAPEYGAAKGAEDFLLKFSDQHMKGLLDKGPETISFNIVMRAWSNSGDDKGAERALEIFNLMKKLHAEGHERVKPDNISLLAVMNAFAKKGDVEMTENLFRNSGVGGDRNLCCHCLISAYANSNRPDAGECAERLLTELTPNEWTHPAVLRAYAKADRPDAAYLCEDFLGRAVEKYLAYESEVRPTRNSFNIVLQAWQVHSDKKVAAERSLALLQDMRSLAKQWMLQTKPDTSTYHFVIKLWSHVDVGKAMELLGEAERWKVIPSVDSYNAILRALAVNATHQSMEKVLEFVDMMEKKGLATQATYNTVLRAYTTIASPASKAEALALLDRMERGARHGVRTMRPNMLTYICILNQLSIQPNEDDVRMGADIFNRMRQLHSDPSSAGELDLAAHSSFLHLLSRARSKVGAEIAFQIFNLMSSEDYPVRPDGFCMDCMIIANACAPHVNYTIVAHRQLVVLSRLYLDKKIKYHPGLTSFKTVLHAWSRCRYNNKLNMAVELMNIVIKVREADSDGIGVENVAGLYKACFTVFASAYFVEDGVLEAERILDSYPAADVSQWNVVLRLWSRSMARDKALQARRLLLKMISSESAPRPDAGSFNAVFNAIAYSHYATPDDKLQGLNLVTETLDELMRSDHANPDHVSYGTIIKCFRELKDPSSERAAAIAAMVERCKADGFFDVFVINEMKQALPPDTFKELLGDAAEAVVANQDISAIPIEWRRSIPRTAAEYPRQLRS